jgi:2,3-bisphosphoglycerate-dependent phosphoglycerate mutase
MYKYKIVLLRHGESTWNKQNKFTGWTDVGLSKKGILEAQQAGKTLQQKKYQFDLIFCSVLKRAKQTLNFALKEMKIKKIPIEYSWRLNERHYGALQGLNKAQMAAKYGEKQVYIWRRSYTIRPPALKKSDPRHPLHDPLYKNVPKKYLPSCECLKDTVKRFVPYWLSDIAPAIKSHKKILIAAHGNSLRALVKYLDKVSDKEIPLLNIPTGIPLVYELDKNLKPRRHYYLASKKDLEKAITNVAAQGKVK